MGESKIIVVMPSLNEELTIGSMVLRAKKQVDRLLVIADSEMNRWW